MGRLENKVGMITGGARGLGAAQCRLFAKEGAAVAVADVDLDGAKALAAEIKGVGGQANAYQLDVADEQAWDKVVTDVIEDFGGLDVLVNNAGIARLGSVEDCTLADWRAVMAVNLDGVFLGARAAVRNMKSRRGGSIINISSIYGIVGDPSAAAYNASKGGVRNFTKSVALHCAKSGYNIRVNSVHPGFVLTDMVAAAAASLPDPDGFLKDLISRHPLGRLCEADDVARAVLYLASDDARNVTGTELIVDAGYLAQ